MIDEKEIPSGWAIAKLGEVCEITTGKWDANHAVKNGKYRFYTCAYDFAYCDTNRFSGESIILPGNGANVGEVFFYNGAFDAYQRTYVINEIKIFPKYLFYHLKLFWKRGTDVKQYGSATNYIRIGNFLEYELSFPSLTEQHRIISKIEEYITELEKGIEQLKSSQRQLEIYEQSIMKYAFEGRLTHKEISKGELPKGWKLLKLKDLVEDKVGLRRGPFGSAIKKEFFVADGYKVYEQGNAINDDPYRGKYFIDEKKYQELIAFKVIPKDLIVSCSGVTLGRISEIPEDGKEGIINQALLRIRLKKNLISNKFFIIHFRAAFFQKKIFEQSQGTAMPNLVGIKDFKEIEMMIPPPEEQELLVQEIENKMLLCRKIEEIVETTLKQSEILRYSILKKAFEGKLVEQNPKDEPAQKLLERIRAEKKKNEPEKKLNRKVKTAHAIS